MSPPARPRVHFVSLGCPKNLVDTEVMLGATRAGGHEIVAEASEAEVIVVNTCGFIGEAKEESVNTILEMARLKATGSCKKLIVTGCLSQRYPQDVADNMPEVDQIFGSGEVVKVAAALHLGPVAADARIDVAAEPSYLYDARTARELAGPAYSTYVKIAEGCDRPCAFCIIPKLRGPQRSRQLDDVVREVEDLVARGTREVNLVAQDLTKYGDDLPGDRPNLAGLLRAVARVPGLRWVRLHYAYPTAVTDELIDVIASEPAVVKYLDVPFQHVDDLVLKRMRRGHTARTLYELVEKLRVRVPGIVIRTTFLVGHPGETEEAFMRLEEFVRTAELDHVGAFVFSKEDGTASAELDGEVPTRVAKARKNRLMRLQRRLSRQRQKALVGRELEVLVEGVSRESEYLLAGRWAGQAPEVDGVVYLADGTARPGDFVRARVTSFADYDLAASIIGVSDPRTRVIGVKLPVLA
ncbi:MAG: 30S ribosomal protein S12 methylthiotransferase RimO [Myxococcales bacterium]|nr:30S ribosomal protein S12 methylthiotransferase RimO [Myxococcales bacterium]